MKISRSSSTKIKASLLLLAGGSGVRMGGNKLYLRINGNPLIEQIISELSPFFEETLLLVARGEKQHVMNELGAILKNFSVEIIEDERVGIGPLEGLRSGLEKMSQPWAFLIGCDMPTVEKELALFMSEFCEDEADVVAAELNGHIEPLHAFYSKNCLPAIRKTIKNKQGKIKSFYKKINLILVKEELLQEQGNPKKSFFNLNYPDDIQKMKKMAL